MITPHRKRSMFSGIHMMGSSVYGPAFRPFAGLINATQGRDVESITLNGESGAQIGESTPRKC